MYSKDIVFDISYQSIIKPIVAPAGTDVALEVTVLDSGINILDKGTVNNPVYVSCSDKAVEIKNKKTLSLRAKPGRNEIELKYSLTYGKHTKNNNRIITIPIVIIGVENIKEGIS